jgi:hypothetical protein
MRALLWVVCAMGGVGCSDGAAARAPDGVCRQGTPAIDADVFARLTATTWLDAGRCGANSDPLPPTCNRLRLAGDGTYDWSATSDYPERAQSGTWNFFARDVDGGIVCLDDGSVVDFALSATGKLAWGMLGELAPDSPLGGGSRTALPTVSVAPLFMALIEHDWRKTNEIDVYSQPTGFSLSDDGTFVAEFRDGECEANGTFSLIKDRTELQLWPRASPNACDLRGGGTTANLVGSGIPPVIEDGILHLYAASYRDAAIQTEQRYLAFSSYLVDQAGLFVAASWDQAIRSGSQTTWAMTLHNRTARAQTVTALRLTQTPLMISGDGFTGVGAELPLVDRSFTDVTIAPAGSFAVEVAFTPTATGWVMLQLEIDSADSSQPYYNNRHFILML